MSKKKSSLSKPTGAKAQPAASKKSAPAKNQTWIWVAAAVVILLVVAGGIYLMQSGTGTQAAQRLPAEISVEEAYQKYQAGTFLLDVRTQEEWNEYHAPNTTLIPLDELPNRVNELPKDQEIVVICRSGNRSQQGRDILKDAGFTQVTSMAGGLKAWRTAGYPTVEGQ